MNDTPQLVLPNKPLVEALLEIKWELRDGTPGPVDPGFPFAVGTLFEQVRGTYPFREELPVVQVPDAMTPHLVRHRFRKAEGSWPVVQLGPGVATINYTDGYTWDAFRAAVLTFVPQLATAYRDVYELRPISVLLRYINAVDFDCRKADALRFLAEHLNTQLVPPREILNSEYRSGHPEAVAFMLSLPVSRPQATATISLSTGKRADAPALVWEHHVHSKGPKTPKLDGSFAEWLDEAHDLAEKWFLTLVDGPLFASFRGEEPNA